MSKFLYVSDLDGTLLNNQTALSVFTRNSLLDILILKEKNFTIATARSLTTAKEILGEIPFELPIIQLNGALISDYHSGEDFYRVFLEMEYSERLINIFKEYSVCFLSSCKEPKQGGDISRCLMPEKRNQAMEMFYQDRIHKNDSRIKVAHTPEYCFDYKNISFTVIEEHTKSQEIFKLIKSELEDKLEIYPMGVDRMGWEWTTIQSKQATKGKAVEKICELFSYPKEKTTIFGDNINDLSMFEKGFIGVAVENAEKRVIKVANKVIPHHNLDSVIKYILSDPIIVS